MWNPVTGKRLAPPLLAESAPITSLAFDPAGRRFATTAYADGTVKMWFTAGLQQEGPRLAADPGATAAAAFELGGKDLLVVDDRGGAFAWPTSPAAWPAGRLRAGRPQPDASRVGAVRGRGRHTPRSAGELTFDWLGTRRGTCDGLDAAHRRSAGTPSLGWCPAGTASYDY